MRKDPASFRDPSGFVYRGEDGLLYRRVNPVYEEHYRLLMESGLYQSLVEDRLMISHEEVPSEADVAGRTLRPVELGFVSYPYEWSFSQYQEAALLTLEIQHRALTHGMTLKDASAYNVAFEAGRPVFIDTLSFERTDPGSPWVAYGQFCSHFLAPLTLMAYTDIRLQQLMAEFIDGIPLDLACRLLPWRCRLRPGLLAHLFAHAWMQKRHADTSRETKKPVTSPRVSEAGIKGIVEGLKTTVAGLKWKAGGTEWADYYGSSSYDDQAVERKKEIVGALLDKVKPDRVWDLGANTGLFGRLAADRGALTVAFDVDPSCVESCYREERSHGEGRLLPLLLDLSNPSPSLGWAHQERKSLEQRGPADVVMMLALVHHLAISNNVPLALIIQWARSLCHWLIIEWVPKTDPQVQRLLRSREDVFVDYTQESFEVELADHFELLETHQVGSDGRLIYLCRGRMSAFQR